jgi:hypothetical protein
MLSRAYIDTCGHYSSRSLLMKSQERTEMYEAVVQRGNFFSRLVVPIGFSPAVDGVLNPGLLFDCQVTEEDIDQFSRSYRGSDEEAKDLKEQYAKSKGDMNQWVFCLYPLDKHRL